MKSIDELGRRLDALARPETKGWWERYLKGALPFRGVRMADIRRSLHQWHREDRIFERAVDDQLALSMLLLKQRHAEDKLAGILFLQEFLLKDCISRWQEVIPTFADLFDEGHISDWNTCDWFCVKVLGPLVSGAGEGAARAVAGWRDAENLWRRRASCVAFVNLAKKGEAHYPGFSRMLLEICDRTVRSPERFAQTGTGWLLRELSVADPDLVRSFIGEHSGYLSSEGLRYATEKMDPDERDALRRSVAVAR